MFTAQGKDVKRNEVPALFGDHLEAVTGIVFHAEHVARICPHVNVSVRSNDADVSFNLMYHVGAAYMG